MVELTSPAAAARHRRLRPDPRPSSLATVKKLQRGGMFLTVLIVVIVFLMVVKPGRLRAARLWPLRDGTGGYHDIDPPAGECPDAARRDLARRPPRPPRRAPPISTATASSSTTSGRSARAPSATSPGRRRSATDEATAEAAQLARLGGEPGARRPLGEHPGPVHGPGPRRGLGLHRAGDQPPRPDVRHGADRLRDGRGRPTSGR